MSAMTTSAPPPPHRLVAERTMSKPRAEQPPMHSAEGVLVTRRVRVVKRAAGTRCTAPPRYRSYAMAAAKGAAAAAAAQSCRRRPPARSPAPAREPPAAAPALRWRLRSRRPPAAARAPAARARRAGRGSDSHEMRVELGGASAGCTPGSRRAPPGRRLVVAWLGIWLAHPRPPAGLPASWLSPYGGLIPEARFDVRSMPAARCRRSRHGTIAPSSAGPAC